MNTELNIEKANCAGLIVGKEIRKMFKVVYDFISVLIIVIICGTIVFIAGIFNGYIKEREGV